MSKRKKKRRRSRQGADMHGCRPRRETLTLKEVEPGKRFTWADGPRVGDGFRRTLNGYLCEQTWEHFPLAPQADAPVKLLPALTAQEMVNGADRG